jgi:hypothetical protein
MGSETPWLALADTDLERATTMPDTMAKAITARLAHQSRVPTENPASCFRMKMPPWEERCSDQNVSRAVSA